MRSLFNQRTVEVGIVVAFLILLGVLIVPNRIRARNESFKNACVNNLRLIDASKVEWELVEHKTEAVTPTVKDLWPYLGGHTHPFDETDEAELHMCPKDPAESFKTSYSIRSVAELPSCLIEPKYHVEPPR